MSRLNPFKVIVADDSPVFRFGLATLLKNVPFISKVVREAKDENEVLGNLEKNIFDIVFIDIQMQRMHGIETIYKIIKQFPKVKVIALLMDERNIYTDEILHSGANGFILKNCDKQEIINALVQVCNGEQYFAPQVLNLISLNNKEKIRLRKSSIADKNMIAIMYLIYHEKTSKEIAGILNLSPRTIEDYRIKILRRTNSDNMIGIIKYVVENGIHIDALMIASYGRFCVKRDHQMIDYIR